MSRTYAQMSALISQKLQDTGVTTYVAAEINYQIEEVLKEISGWVPHLVELPFSIESRFGTATSTSANNLVDTKAQFVSTDPTNEKVVYNPDDKTWATIVSYSSTSQVGLSNDIFTSGERYYIFNRQCRNNRQIYVGGAFDPFSIIRAEYPTSYWPRRWRNVNVINPNVVGIRLDIEPDDSNSTLSPVKRTEVIVEFNRPHLLCQLTDLAGEVNNVAGYAAGDTSMATNGWQTTGTIEAGDEFYIENLRRVYKVTADAAIAANAATISFYPGLEATVANDDDITFVGSTLSPELEDALAWIVTGDLMTNKAPKYLTNLSNIIGASAVDNFLKTGESFRAKGITILKRYPRLTSRSYSTT